MSYFTETLDFTYDKLLEMNGGVFVAAMKAAEHHNLEYTNAKGKKFKGEMAYQNWSCDMIKPLKFSDRYRVIRKCEAAASKCAREKQYNLNKVKINI